VSACDNYRLAPGYRHTCVCGRPDSFHETVQQAHSDGQLTTDGAPLLLGAPSEPAPDAAPGPAECSEGTATPATLAGAGVANNAGPAAYVPATAGPALSPTARAYRCGQLTAAIQAAITMLCLDDGAATEEALALLRRELADTAWEAQ
jgi:hypothetical protein